MISCPVFVNHLSIILVIALNALLIGGVQPELKLVNVVSCYNLIKQLSILYKTKAKLFSRLFFSDIISLMI